jgi:hypothetical protein
MLVVVEDAITVLPCLLVVLVVVEREVEHLVHRQDILQIREHKVQVVVVVVQETL